MSLSSNLSSGKVASKGLDVLGGREKSLCLSVVEIHSLDLSTHILESINFRVICLHRTFDISAGKVTLRDDDKRIHGFNMRLHELTYELRR